MRICASCGFLLNEDDTVCPFCGEGAGGDLYGAQDTAAEGPASAAADTPLFAVASDNEASEAEEESAFPAAAEEERPDEEPDSAEEAGTEDYEEETFTESDVRTAPEDADAAEEDEAEKDVTEVFHGTQDDEDRPLRKRSSLFSKVLLILAALAVAGTVFGIVLPYFRMSDDSEAAKEKAYMDFICGSWISNSFVYSDGSFPSKEILIVNKDYTYSSYIVASPDGSEEYDAATWKVTDRDEGVFSISIENSAIAVTYNTTSGDSYSYLRYIRRLDGSSLTLREYYNEQMTDYFDVIFTRMEG